MPHLILEHHANLSEKTISTLLPKLTQCIADSHPSFKRSECKARALAYPISCIGDGQQSNDFVHLTVRVLDGRPNSVLQALTQHLFRVLETESKAWPVPAALSVWVTEMNRAHYQKSNQASLCEAGAQGPTPR